MLEGGIDCRLFQKLNLELDHHNHHLSLHSIEQDACSIFFFLLRHGNRTTPNCRTQLLDATKAGALKNVDVDESFHE